MRHLWLAVLLALSAAACTTDESELADAAPPPAPDAWVSHVPDGVTPTQACLDMMDAVRAMDARCGTTHVYDSCEGVVGIGSYEAVYDGCLPWLGEVCLAEGATLAGPPCFYMILR